MNTTYTTFEKTLSGLSQGLQVRHIATSDIKTCAPEENVAAVLARYPNFDQIPVKDEQRVIGVIERNGGREGLVAARMRRLDDGILIAADEALSNFIPLMAQTPYYRLVVSGAQIDGVVTRSDLLKLPVRLLGFAIVTNLELLMKEIIAQQLPDDNAWMALLSEGRQEKVLCKQKDYRTKHIDPPLVELTDFADKKTILKKHLKLSSKFEKDLAQVENLRNTIAHAGNYAVDETELQAFIANLQKAKHWIEELNKWLR
jgi:CBS domain-containing protein